MIIVYKTTNLVNGKIYIGVHCGKDPLYLGSGRAIREAIKKYGRENFKRETLFELETHEEAYKKEGEIVNEEFVKSKENYNLRVGGKGGSKHSEETKLLLSGIARRRVRVASGFKGKRHNSETKAKISLSRKGSQNSEYQKTRAREANLGKIVTKETREKLSAALKNRVANNKGKPMAHAQKVKISEARKGKVPCFDLKAGVGRLVSRAEFEASDHLVGITSAKAQKFRAYSTQ